MDIGGHQQTPSHGRARMTVMRLPSLRRTRSSEPGVLTGTVRLDRRTKRLVGRLRPGEIAVIDHVDLDRVAAEALVAAGVADRKSTRLNSSHVKISYAVFCLKKKNNSERRKK